LAYLIFFIKDFQISFRTFESALDLGCGRGLTASELTKDVVKRITMIDSSSLMLNQIRPPVEENGHDGIEIIKKHLDEEHLIGDESSYDLAYSCLSLHWINDLPGVFRKVLNLLKNDAPFIGKYMRILTLIKCTLYVFRCNVCLRYFI